MKYNDRELAYISLKSKPDLEGRLAHQKAAGGGDWSDWYGPAPFKERWFKLKSNLLFYYRITEIDSVEPMQPVGVLVLESARVEYERSKQVPFAFSIGYQDDPDKKHIFSCRSEEDVEKWVVALRSSSYEHWRSRRKILEKKISMLPSRTAGSSTQGNLIEF